MRRVVFDEADTLPLGCAGIIAAVLVVTGFAWGWDVIGAVVFGGISAVATLVFVGYWCVRDKVWRRRK